MKLIIYNDCLGEIVRIGLYNDKGKWIKWIPKKQLDEYEEKVEDVENREV